MVLPSFVYDVCDVKNALSQLRYAFKINYLVKTFTQIQIYNLSIVTGYIYKTYQIDKSNAIKPHCCLDSGLIFNLIFRTVNKIHKTNLILSFSQKTKLWSKAPLASSHSKSRTTIQNVRIAFSNRKFVRCVFTFTAAIACSTFELWRQTYSATTVAIGYGQVILYRLVCTLHDSWAFSRQNFRKN